MEFNYRYKESSYVKSLPDSTGLSFSPDTSRKQPAYFTGSLINKHIPFREAISALHDVVVSNLKFVPKDKTEYKEWAAQQEEIWLAQMMATKEETAARIDELQKELDGLNRQRAKIIGPFEKARKKYYDHIYKHDYNKWFVLDPVITVHPDEVFFECFSQDESSYGKLGCDYNIFDNMGDFSCGTTNIDYSSSLYDEFQKIRDYKKTALEIDPSGFSVKTGYDEQYKEVKIDLPDSWVRGFLQVSSAMTMDTVSFDLHPMDIHNFCFILRRYKEKHGPRSMRYILEPGKPIKVIFEPWNYEIKCSRSVYTGNQEHEIRVWGRRRLLILERLIPVASNFRVHLLGTGMPSFYVADLKDLNFTLGLSGWSANDWSKLGNFDLMAPRAETDSMTKQKVYTALKENWFETEDSLAARLDLDKASVLGALSSFVQAGRAIYDLDKKVYRVRELSQESLPVEMLRFSNEREKEATRLVNENGVTIKERKAVKEVLTISGRVKQKRRRYLPNITIDSDQRLVQGSCSCNFFKQNRLYKGPCEHMLALRIMCSKKSGVKIG